MKSLIFDPTGIALLSLFMKWPTPFRGNVRNDRSHASQKNFLRVPDVMRKYFFFKNKKKKIKIIFSQDELTQKKNFWKKFLKKKIKKNFSAIKLFQSRLKKFHFDQNIFFKNFCFIENRCFEKTIKSISIKITCDSRVIFWGPKNGRKTGFSGGTQKVVFFCTPPLPGADEPRHKCYCLVYAPPPLSRTLFWHIFGTPRKWHVNHDRFSSLFDHVDLSIFMKIGLW